MRGNDLAGGVSVLYPFDYGSEDCVRELDTSKGLSSGRNSIASYHRVGRLP